MPKNILQIISFYRNQDLNELISSALRDLTESEFIGDRDSQNIPLPCKPITNIDKIPQKGDYHFFLHKQM